MSTPLFHEKRMSETCICQTNNEIETCFCPGDEKNLSNQGHTRSTIEYDPLTTLGLSAATGIVFAALPEALGDALYLSGVVSQRNSYHVKMATNAALVFATGSWIPAGTSWLTSAGLQYLGCSESKARVCGNTAAFLVNAGRNLTPTVMAATAVNYAAGRVGLWAEKKMMKKAFSNRNLSIAPTL